MENYKFKKLKGKRKLIDSLEEGAYSFKPKNNKNSKIKVSNISLYNEELIHNVMLERFDISFKSLFKLVSDICDDDGSNTSTGDIKHALDQCEFLKSKLRDEYKKKIEMEKYYDMWNKISLLEKQLASKLINQRIQNEVYRSQMMQYFNSYNEEAEEKGRGR